MDPMDPTDTGGSDDVTISKQLLDELLSLARGGQARDMAARLGKGPVAPTGDLPPPDDAGLEGSPDEEAAESPDQEAAEPIPGVEGEDPAAGDLAAGDKPDPMKMRALLAHMKAGKGA